MKKFRFLIVSIGILVVIAIAVIAYFRVSSLGGGNFPLTVSITSLDGGGAYPVSGGLPVRTQAISSAPISHLEFWADGQLIETIRAPIKNLYVFAHTWTWTPKTLGDHTLIVRAFDAQGQGSPSSVIHIQAIPDSGMILVVTSSTDDTLESLAIKYKASPDAILAANPNLNANEPLPGDIFIPLPAPSEINTTSSKPTNSTLADNNQVNKGGIDLSFTNWIRMEFINPLGEMFAPAAPQLSATTTDCNALLTITDLANNENGFYVYRLDPQTNDFVKIASLPNHNDSNPIQFTDKNLYGTFQYYVSAYDGSGEGVSNFVKVNVSGESCTQLADTFSLTQLVAFDPGKVEKTYLYLSVNQRDWSRIPQDPQQFLAPNASINLSKAASIFAVKPAPVLSVRGEMWGWSSGTLVFLGNFNKNVTPPSQPLSAQDFALPSTTLYMRKNDPSAPSSGNSYLWMDKVSVVTLGNEYFKWTTGSEEATHGQWQISKLPFTNNLDLNPPGLLLTGEAPPSPKGNFIQFPIDLRLLNPDNSKNSTTQINTQPNTQSKIVPQFSPFAPPFYSVNAGNDPIQLIQRVFGLPSFNQASTVPDFWFTTPKNSNNQNVTTSPTGINPSDLFIRYYVRILPMKGDEAVGDPSAILPIWLFWIITGKAALPSHCLRHRPSLTNSRSQIFNHCTSQIQTMNIASRLLRTLITINLLMIRQNFTGH